MSKTLKNRAYTAILCSICFFEIISFLLFLLELYLRFTEYTFQHILITVSSCLVVSANMVVLSKLPHVTSCQLFVYKIFKNVCFAIFMIVFVRKAHSDGSIALFLVAVFLKLYLLGTIYFMRKMLASFEEPEENDYWVELQENKP